MILFLLSLLAGVLTVLAPCTISLLPVIVGGSLAGGTSFRRTAVVIASLGISVILFTLLLKVSTAFISVPQSFWQLFSGVIIMGLGLTMIFPALWDHIPLVNRINRGSNKLLATGYMKQSVFGDVLVGAALGPVFSSCSPTYFLIIATVLPRSILEGSVYLLAYAVGLCVALLVVATAGQKLLETFGVAADPNGFLKRGVGVLFLLVGLAIAFGIDRKLELAVVNSGFLNVASFEQKFLAQTLPPGPKPSPVVDATSTRPVSATTVATSTTPIKASTLPDATARIAGKVLLYQRVPEITKPSGFINTDGKPITLASLKGKVVLVDFWTYSCINCQRTLPYLKAWYDKYTSQGLVIVGIHTPEFSFEKVQANVETAVKNDQVKYPVVLDNDFGTWNAFGNQFWPHKYLVDADGFIVYDYAGEGNYDGFEVQIQKALKERSANMAAPISVSTGTVKPADTISVDPSRVGSPETYFGSNRNEYLANGARGRSGNQTLTLPASPSTNQLYLGGVWNFQPEYAEAIAPSTKILYKFNSRDVYFVASSAEGAKLKILVDGTPAGTNAGVDVTVDGTALIKENRLYKLVHLPEYGTHVLEIDLESGTLDAYTFTFG